MAKRMMGGIALVIALAGVNMQCQNYPAKSAKVESDLCDIRSKVRVSEDVFPLTRPDPGTLRAEIEATEDAFCAARSDAGP